MSRLIPYARDMILYATMVIRTYFAFILGYTPRISLAMKAARNLGMPNGPSHVHTR
jgi:hypothetical protein